MKITKTITKDIMQDKAPINTEESAASPTKINQPMTTEIPTKATESLINPTTRKNIPEWTNTHNKVHYTMSNLTKSRRGDETRKILMTMA